MDDERTVWCGNLSEKVTEELLYELFLQAGPVERVKIPKDNNGRQRTFGFITFNHTCSVLYSVALFEGTSLYNKVLLLQSRNGTNSDIAQGQTDMNNIHSSSRQRTHSLPINFGSTAAAVPDYNMLLQLGNQMLIPGSMGSEQFWLNQHHESAPSSSLPLYRSQMNSSYYFGGNREKISKNNRNNYENSRHHPYTSGGESRGHENSHSNNSHHNSSKSSHHRHDRRYSGRRHH